MTFPRPARFRRHVSTRAARHKFLRSLLASSFSFILCVGVCAQTTTAPEDEEVLHVRVDLITVPVYVTGERGRRVTGLTSQDFHVRDGGQSVEINYFSAGTERVALLFALDASGSAREHISQQTEAALAMFTRFGGNSRVAVLPFSEQAQLTLPFTGDIAGARGAFQLSARPNQRTAIFDAALVAVRAFDMARPDARERRIVVLLSDGLDTVSRTHPASVVSEARQRGVSLYVIHFPLFAPSNGQLSMRRPAKGFRQLAEQTGGNYFQLGDARSALDPHATYDLAPVFRAIAEDLASQYVLGYYLDEAARNRSDHRIQVNLSPQHKQLRVRALRENYGLKQ